MTALDWVFYGNSARTWLVAIAAALLAYVLLRVVKAVVLRSLEHLAGRTRSPLDDVLAEAVRATRGWFLVAAALFAGTLLLLLPDRLREILQQAIILLLLLQMGIWGSVAVRAHVARHTAQNIDADADSITTMRALAFLARVVLWSVVLLMALDNVGIDITALLAGLGVGGVAVALAVQNILGDLFASLSIVLDKPFVYGDFIVVGDMAGTVDHVGLKTTRLRSLSGEQLIFSNSDLLQSRIRNYKRMFERRAVFSIGVVYQTGSDALERIPRIIREAIEAQPDVRFDRAHFKTFGPSSLDFEIVYHVLDPDFNLYMDRQQAINLEIFRRFEAEGLEFAYPTQTLYLTRDNGADAAAQGRERRPAERV